MAKKAGRSETRSGNEADVEIGEVLLWLARDPGVRVIMAYAEGLRQSMVATVIFLVIAAAFYFLASRTFLKDRWSPAAD